MTASLADPAPYCPGCRGNVAGISTARKGTTAAHGGALASRVVAVGAPPAARWGSQVCPRHRPRGRSRGDRGVRSWLRESYVRRAEEPACRPTSPLGSTSRKSPRVRARWKGRDRRRRVRRPGRGRARSTRPTLVSNWTQFTSTFGGFVAGSYLAQSVYGYFMNGGGNCYVVRIGQNGASGGPRRAAPGPRSWRPARPRRSAGSRSTPSTRPSQPGEVSVEVTDPGGDSPVRGHVPSWWSSATARWSRSSTGPASAGASRTSSPWSTRPPRPIQLEDTSSGAVERLAQRRDRPGRPAVAPAALPSTRLERRRLRRRRRRPHRFRRPGGRRGDHHALRARPDERLPAGRDRPRHRAGGADGDDRPLRADGRPGRHPGLRRPA